MELARQRLRLMQLSSSSLPVGSFTWSQGLEWAVETGWVTDAEAFKNWQTLQMEQSFFCVDLPLFARLYRACEEAIWRQQNAGRHTCSPVGKPVNCGKKNAIAAPPLRGSSKLEPDCPPSGSRCLCKASSAAWRGLACVGVLARTSWR